MAETSAYRFIQEIYEQPAGLRQTLVESGPVAERLAHELAARIERVVLVGCGDPHFLSYAAARAFEQLAQLPASATEALEFWLYGGECLNGRTLVVAISQSGKSIQVVQALRLARHVGALSLAVTNSPGSPVTQEAEAVLLTRCGLSLSFPTKTTTSALVLLFRLAVALGHARGRLSSERAAALLADLDAVPAHIERALEFELRVQALVTDLSGCEHFSFIGAGPGYTAALLAEAKLKETSHTRAEAHQLEEFAHVHLFAMQPRDPLFFIAPSDRTSARAREIAAYAVEYGARCVAVVVEGDGAAWRDLGAEVFELPVVQEVFSPLIHVIPLQLFAYHLALAKGHNPDRPARFDNAIHQKLVYSDVLEGWHEDD